MKLSKGTQLRGNMHLNFHLMFVVLAMKSNFYTEGIFLKLVVTNL